MNPHSIKLQWAIVCMGGAVDQQTNSLSLFDILEEFQIGVKEKITSEGIFVPRSFKFISLWCNDKGKALSFLTKIVLQSPDGEQLMELEGELSVPENKFAHRHIVDFPGFQIKGGGRYKFLVYKKEKDESNYQLEKDVPFDVKIEIIKTF